MQRMGSELPFLKDLGGWLFAHPYKTRRFSVLMSFFWAIFLVPGSITDMKYVAIELVGVKIASNIFKEAF